MPFDVSWYESEKIVYVKYTGMMSLDEVKAASSQVFTMIEAIVQKYPDREQHIIHAIMDHLEMDKYDFNMMEMVKFLRNQGKLEKQGGYIAVINKKSVASKATELFMSVMGSLQNFKMRTFYDLESAVSFLHQIDDALSLVEHSKDGSSI